VSLGFVVLALVEFAIVMMVYRNSDGVHGKLKVTPIQATTKVGRASQKDKSSPRAIDNIAFWVFLLLIISFNSFYFFYYLNSQCK
jgi:hypothetical protein